MGGGRAGLEAFNWGIGRVKNHNNRVKSHRSSSTLRLSHRVSLALAFLLDLSLSSARPIFVVLGCAEEMKKSALLPLMDRLQVLPRSYSLPPQKIYYRLCYSHLFSPMSRMINFNSSAVSRLYAYTCRFSDLILTPTSSEEESGFLDTRPTSSRHRESLYYTSMKSVSFKELFSLKLSSMKSFKGA